MGDYLSTSIVLAFGVLLHLAILRRSTPEERRFLSIAFGGHALSALAHVWLVRFYFPGGDMLGYFEQGLMGSAALRADFGRFAPELWAALWRLEYHLPFEFSGASSTLTTAAASSFVLFVVGDSLYGACMAVSLAAYLSQYALYVALRGLFAAEHRLLVLLGTSLIPSGVFWSSGLFKEGLVMASIGPLVLALNWLASGRRQLLAVGLIVVSGVVVALIKPYVLMALSVSSVVFYLGRRFHTTSPQLRPFSVVSALLLGWAGLTMGSSYFEKGDEDTSAATFARQRRAGYGNEGGSDYFLDNPSAVETSAPRSLSEELLVAPLGLATALFRPLIFEARNAVQFANSLEATLLLILFIQIIRRWGWAGMVRETLRSPVLAFCAIFALSLGLGTGLASSNLGTLSRYRAPMMPFFFTFLLVLRFGAPRRATNGASVGSATTPGPAARSPWQGSASRAGTQGR